MTNDQAEREAITRWSALPEAERQNYKQAQDFAKAIAPDLDFRTMGEKSKIVAAWLIREMGAPVAKPVSLEVPLAETEAPGDEPVYSSQQEAEDDSALEVGDQQDAPDWEADADAEPYGPPVEHARSADAA